MSDLRKRSRFTLDKSVELTSVNDRTVLQKRLLLPDRQTTVDEEHPWWYRIQRHIHLPQNAWMINSGAGRFDMGGEFTSHRTSARVTGDFVNLRAFLYQGRYIYQFQGYLIPNLYQPAAASQPLLDAWGDPGGFTSVTFDSRNTNSAIWGTLSDTDASMQVFGASAVSKLAPTAPHNSVYTSLGELRNDGLPSIPGLSFLKKDGALPQQIGGEYLNYQFGLVPTYSDLMKIKQTIDKAEKLWKQYLRDSGNVVRRRMVTEPVVTTTTTSYAQNGSRYPLETKVDYWASAGAVTVTTTTETTLWASAAFQYFVDKTSLDGIRGFSDRMHYLYGWKPTPSSAYNLQAWTWLLDWFTNTGDVIENISLYLEDPSLMRWGYVMEQSKRVTTITQPLVEKSGAGRTASIEFTTVSKKRRRINPLHFGLLYEELDARQLAILAALGLNRFRDPGLM